MFIVDAQITIRPEQRLAFLSMMQRVIAETRREPGNLSFRLTADLDDPSMFALFEQWESEVASREHLRQPYLVELTDAAPAFGPTIDIGPHEGSSCSHSVGVHCGRRSHRSSVASLLSKSSRVCSVSSRPERYTISGQRRSNVGDFFDRRVALANAGTFAGR